MPFESTAARLPQLIANSQLVVIPGGPRAINWTHADQMNLALLDFLKKNSSKTGSDPEVGGKTSSLKAST